MTKVPPFMGDFSDDDIAWAIRVGVRRRVRADELIIVEGEQPRELFVILEGSFVVESRQLNRPNMKRLGPGELVGEMSYINKQVPVSSVRALEDSELLCIPRTALDEKIAEDAAFGGRFHKVVSEFAVARLYAWSPPPTAGRPAEGVLEPAAEGSPGLDAPIDPAAPSAEDSLRVYELIERMLRGEFPDLAPPRMPDATRGEPPRRPRGEKKPPQRKPRKEDEPPGSN